MSKHQIEDVAANMLRRNLKIHQSQGRRLERVMRRQRKQLRDTISSFYPSQRVGRASFALTAGKQTVARKAISTMELTVSPRVADQ